MADLQAGHPQIEESELQQAKTFSALLLDEAKRQGASDAEVQWSQSNGFGVRVRLGEVDNVEIDNQTQIAVICFRGQKKGIATTTDVRPDSVKSLVAKALAIANEVEEDAFAGLANNNQLATDVPDLDRYHPWAITPDEALDLALASEAVARQDKRIVNSDGASVSSQVGLSWYANSRGFSEGYRYSGHSMSCVVIAGDQQKMQRDYDYDSHCVATALKSPEAIGREAARRALSRLGGRQPPTGDYPILLDARVASSLLAHFVGAISGSNLYRKNSFLQHSLGQVVFPDWVTIGEKPRWKTLSGSAAFDGDGLATREQKFVQQGRLEQYALSLYSSRQLGLEPTGNGGGVRNLTISHTGHSQEQLLKEMGTGLLITEFMGSAINAVTGDYSRGAAGFWVENGEIAYPVEEFTLAGRLQDMFANLVASGTDVDRKGRIHCGSLLLAPMKVAGN